MANKVKKYWVKTNGQWYYKKRYEMPDGTKPYVYSKIGAKDWKEKAVAKYNNYETSKALSNRTIGDELDAMMSNLELKCADKTVNDYKHLITHIKDNYYPELVDKKKVKFFDIKMSDINTQYAIYLADKIKSHSSVGIAWRVIRLVNQAITYHMDYERGLKVNPISSIVQKDLRMEMTNKEEIDLFPVISTVNVQSMLDYFKYSPYRFAFHFMALHGMRISESTGVNWDDIDFKKDTIHIHQQIGYKGEIVRTKSKKQRYVPLASATKKLLLETPAEERTGLVTLTKKGTACKGDNLRKRHFNKAREYLLEQNPDFNILTTHQFRKFYISYHIDRGTPIQTVSSRVGHADSSITLKIYTKTIKETSKFNADLMSGLFMDIKPQVISIKKDVRLSV